MADGNDENGVLNEDDGFASAFEEFAAAKAPHSEAPAEAGQPEGNDPEEPAEAPAQAAAEVEDPPESVTSGKEAGAVEAPAEAAPDPWASAPPELKALWEQERQAREQAEHRARSDAARVAALSRKLATVTPPPQAAEPSEAQKALDAKVKQLREDFPDVAEPIIALIESQRAELSSVKQHVAAVTADQHEVQVARELAALQERHPDWQQVAANPKFGEWLATQPSNVQALAGSWDARETGVVLTLFKVESGIATGGQQREAPAAPAPAAPAAATDTKRARQLEGGADVRSRPAAVASGAPDDYDAAFAHFAAKQEAKRLAQSRR